MCQGDDAHTEECLNLAQEYCLAEPEDTACALFLPVYERVVDELSSLSLFVGDIAVSREVRFVPQDCSCDAK